MRRGEGKKRICLMYLTIFTKTSSEFGSSEREKEHFNEQLLEKRSSEEIHRTITIIILLLFLLLYYYYYYYATIATYNAPAPAGDSQQPRCVGSVWNYEEHP